MRVDLLTPVVELRAAQRGAFTLQVRNDSEVIEQIVCTVPGLDPAWYEVSPVALNLFPGDVGEVRLTLMLPRTFPAGRHDLSAQITGRVRGQTLLQRLIVDIEPQFDTLLVTHPTVITARRRGRYLVTLQNRGNSPSEMAVRAGDSEAALELELDRPVMTVNPGEQQTTALYARGKRPWFGSPVAHQIEVTAEQLPEVLAEKVTLRLRPRLTAGVITALTLALIVAAWATVLLLSANAAFGTSKPTKAVPDNFFTGVSVAELDPLLFGSALSGTITAQSTGAPLARITVELYGMNGTAQHFVTAVASGSTGGYSLAGVLPGRYRLRFRAPNFPEVWFPNAPSAAEAQVLTVKPSTPQDGLNQAIAGGPGQLTTTVVAGDGAATPVSVKVEAVDVPDAPPIEQTGVAGQPLVFPQLATPAVYRLTATDPSGHFQEAVVTQQLDAGQSVTTNPISMVAAAGTISGVVVDDAGNPLGDIRVTTTVNGKPALTVTPTSGAVGTFSLSGLPTPGTYVLEFSGANVASNVVAVPLEPGVPPPSQRIVMSSATGTLTGIVTADGAGLGGATVTVTGGGFSATATTFTANPPGSFTVTGVPAPGSYVVTVTAPGRVSSSTSVTFADGQSTASVNADLLPAVGRIFGTVTLDGAPIGAATVTVSNGGDSPSSTVSATVGDVGGYAVNGLVPGIYTVTATFGTGTANAAGPVTKLVTVGVNPDQPGQPVVLALTSP